MAPTSGYGELRRQQSLAGPAGLVDDQEWPGPPDPVLDSGPFECTTSLNGEVAAIHLKSQHDEYSGVTLERDLEVRPRDIGGPLASLDAQHLETAGALVESGRSRRWMREG